MAYVTTGYVAEGYVEAAATPPLGYPSESDVRLGVVYGASGEYTGTLSPTSPTLDQIADAVWARAAVTPLPSDTKKMNGSAVIGTGAEGDPWRGQGVQP